MTFTDKHQAKDHTTLLLNPSEAARFLGIAPDTLTVWRCTGRYRLPFVKIGRKVMYRQEDLQTFVEQNRQCNYSSMGA